MPVMLEANFENPLEQVTIVTVTYNSARIVSALAAVLRQFPHTIVVDNASTDSTVTQLRALSPATKILPQTGNLGFGAGNNRGVAAATTPFVLLLNPDCEITPAAVQTLVQCANDFSSAVSVAPTVFNESGQAYPHFRWDFLHAERNHSTYRTEGPISAKVIDGACQLIRVANFKAIGMYDEALFMYYEEDDLGMRATSQGYDMICTPEATAMHVGNASSPPTAKIRFIKNYHPTRSKILMLRKHLSPKVAQRYRQRLLLSGLLAVPLSLLTFRRERIIRQAARWWAAWQTKV